MFRIQNRRLTQIKLSRLIILITVVFAMTACSESPETVASSKDTEEQNVNSAQSQEPRKEKKGDVKSIAEDVVFNSTLPGSINWTVNRGEGEVIQEGAGAVLIRLEAPELFRITSAQGPLRLPPAAGLNFKPRKNETYTLAIRYSVYKVPQALSFVWYEYLPEKMGGRNDTRIRAIPREKGTHEVLAEVPLTKKATGFRLAVQLSDANSTGEIAIEEVLLLRKR